MKKLAILIATLLIVCLMACACGTVEETSTPDSSTETSSTQGTTSTPADPAPSTPADPAPSTPADPEPSTPSNPGTVTPPPAPTGSAYSFETDLSAAKHKDAQVAGTVFGPITITTDVIAYVSTSTKTIKDGSLQGTQVIRGIQLGKNGSFDAKSAKLTLTAGQTIEVFANAGSSSYTGDATLVLVDSTGTVIDSQVFVKDVYSGTFTVTAAGTYALCVNNGVSSINIFAIVA